MLLNQEGLHMKIIILIAYEGKIFLLCTNVRMPLLSLRTALAVSAGLGCCSSSAGMPARCPSIVSIFSQGLMNTTQKKTLNKITDIKALPAPENYFHTGSYSASSGLTWTCTSNHLYASLSVIDSSILSTSL